jgi:hypothetical protein
MSAAEAPKEPLELAAGEVRFGLEIRISDQTKIQRTANGLSVEGLGKDAVEVPERSARFGDCDAAAARRYTDSEGVGSVDRDTAAALASTIARKGDVDRAARRPQHAPESRCALVADDGPLPEREYRGHAPAFEGQSGMPDCVNTTMKAVQPASTDAAGDSVLVDSGVLELSRADHSVPTSGQTCDHSIAIGTFLAHTATKAPTPVPLPFRRRFWSGRSHFLPGFRRPSAI